ncbi:MAG: NAD-dependent epimerase/dehydratase family protein, partial [Streptosporangiaceae bacterium]
MTRVAAVTGGAGAIGSAIAAALRASGHHVATLDRPASAPANPAAPPSQPADLPVDLADQAE